MQPLYSVDHETRQSSYVLEEHSQPIREDTPLLYQFPESVTNRSLFMTITVSLLLMVLIVGVMIGIYLLMIQNNSENVLPPVDTPLQLVSREQWYPEGGSLSELKMYRIKANQVIIVQTDTEQCDNINSCFALLHSIQANTTSAGSKMLPYNFLVSSDGQTYEALGWYRSSTLFAQYPDSLVLAFIGNFTDVSPTTKQINESKNFFDVSVSQQHLDPSYIVFGKRAFYDPKALFCSLKSLPQWSTELSDD